MLSDDESKVFSYAIGPMVSGKRLPPVLRLRIGEKAYLIENKTAGGWRPIGMATTAREAFEALHQANANALKARNMTQWPKQLMGI